MDQADELRQLVRMDAAHAARTPSDAPHLVAVASGKGGVGATTVAVNLAVSLARLGRRVVLVDANFNGADVARLCRLDPEHSIADVLKGIRSVHEVLCRGLAGVLVLPGAWIGETPAECTPKAQERLIAALRSLGPHADDVVLDVGTGISRVNRRFWHASDKVLVVTTPDDAAVMNTYAAIKVLGEGDPQLPVFSLVNLVPDAAAAQSVHERLSRACHRFLARRLEAAGYLPASAEVRNATLRSEAFALTKPECQAAACLERAAQALVALRAQPPAPRLQHSHWQSEHRTASVS